VGGPQSAQVGNHDVTSLSQGKSDLVDPILWEPREPFDETELVEKLQGRRIADPMRNCPAING
jgi:hypothetical protein